MKDFDKANMLGMFDDALSKIIKHLQDGKPDSAKFLAIDIQQNFREVIGYLKNVECSRKHHPPHASII